MPIIDIDGMRVAYEDVGTGLPIVFIPGLVGTREWFRFQISGLRESYRIVSYDVRPAKDRAGYTLDLLTDDLARFLSALKIESAVVAGHCFGAMIAQRFAAQYRSRVHALILMSAFPDMSDESDHTLLEWLSPGTIPSDPPLQSFLRRLFRIAPKAPAEELDGLDWLVARCARLSQTTMETRLNLVRQFNANLWLAQIEAPTLIVVGSRDRAQFLAGAQVLYEGIADSALEVIEDCDHFCFYSRHDAVNAVIDEFLTARLRRL